ncbi:MAG: stage II sporulation protein M [Syntrophomonadaceae bacterium]
MNRHLIKRHISENRWQYFFLVVVFLAGAVLGNYKVPGVDTAVKSQLLSLVDQYIQGEMTGSFVGSSVLIQAFINQARLVLAIWFLGLTVIGLPLILGVVFLRGFSIGFTLGFLISEKAGGGVLISLLAILPQNLVYIPLLIVWGVISINFSLQVLKGAHSGFPGLMRRMVGYTLLMLVFLLLFLLGAVIEAYLSPWLLNLFM